ncbi:MULTISPECIES: DUF4286 family protein [unclassified Beijerinckia]|uniref:DUF4286 family protein n=1 Tax=unclassified Beijerinckia TaxID=2638183 RepID=UPI001114CD39|nr:MULTISPECIES: DUF4286 family protein [unclassified Beijerinckia]
MSGANSGADAFVRSAESVDSAQRLLWIESATAQSIAIPGTQETGTQEISIFALARDVGDGGATAASFLYLVQTDIPDDIVAEYTQWYDVEHLPRLVTVPGILRARRYEAVNAKPRYLTAYDLSDVSAFESPQGLVARKTPWTERMRSKFMNARRSTWRITHSHQ